jgi:hypothetical protein
LTTKRELQRAAQEHFKPLGDDVLLTCSTCDYRRTVGEFRGAT